MLSNRDLTEYCQRLALSPCAISLLEKIRGSEPSRRVQSVMGNVCARYPSRKMGVTIQAESHTVELAAIIEMEHDDDVLEYYDQPPQIKLEYQHPSGKKVGLNHTPDFFVMRTQEVGWVECKPDARLDELALKMPGRYQKAETGVWLCPPGAQYAKLYGFSYRILNSAQIDPVLIQNLNFLDDYFRADCPNVSATIETAVNEIIQQQPGITLAELFPRGGNCFGPDDVYRMVATSQIYIDLKRFPLSERDQTRVYINAEAAQAYRIVSCDPAKPQDGTVHSVEIHIGGTVRWHDREYRILNFNVDDIWLESEDKQISMNKAVFEQHVRAGDITGAKMALVPSFHAEVNRLLSTASLEDFKVANRRYELIQSKKSPALSSPSKRTINRYKREYRKAEVSWGVGYVGLLPHFQACGNRKPRFSEELSQLAQRIIDEHYLTLKQRNAKSVYGTMKLECEKHHLIAPSYQFFLRLIKERSQYSTALARKGRRAAYAFEPSRMQPGETNDNHGTRPWEVVHIDHTKADLELICSQTGQNMGRPWISVMFDAFSRSVLAIHLSFDAPSYRTDMVLLRECVRRHGRLPSSIVTDNGSDFGSTYFETLAAMYECTLIKRPPAKARFGTLIERHFGTLNTQFFNNLAGNTQIMKNVRQVTKSVNPKLQAVWSLEKLYEYLCSFVFKQYNRREHPELHMSPDQAFRDGMHVSGQRSHRLIPYTHDFITLTLPTTRLGKAKIQPRVGVKINRIYYWHNDMTASEGIKVDVRYDPFDFGIAYVRLNGRWVQCFAGCNGLFRGRSEKEIKLATETLRALNRNHSKNRAVTEKELAEFLRGTEAEEALQKQRLRDLAQKSLEGLGDSQSLINGAVQEGSVAARVTAPVDATNSAEVIEKDLEQYADL